MIKLQSGAGLRTWRHDGHEIAAIVLYGQGQAHYRIMQGWLTIVDDRFALNANFEYHANGIALDHLNRANKENLTRTDNYFVPTKNGCRGSEPSKYVLYVHLDRAPEDLGEHEIIKGEQSQTFKSFIRVPLNVSIGRREADSSGRFSTVEVLLKSVTLCTGQRTVSTPFGEEVNRVVKEFEDKDIDVDSYTVAKLLKLYTFVPKV